MPPQVSWKKQNYKTKPPKATGGGTKARAANRIDETVAPKSSLARGGRKAFVAAAAPTDINAQPLDFLVEGRERNEKTFRGFGLIPVGTFEHINDNAALDLIHDLKKRGLRIVGRGARPGFTGKRREKFRELQPDAPDDLFAADAFR
jgi:hypothetical protein